MVQDVLEIIIILVICLMLLYEILNIFTNKANKEEALKSKALELMLYAEKQNWIGEEKFNFVARNIYSICPELVKKVIKTNNIEDWLNILYSNFKSNMKGDFLYEQKSINK